jgi:hypothetical protein
MKMKTLPTKTFGIQQRQLSGEDYSYKCLHLKIKEISNKSPNMHFQDFKKTRSQPKAVK